MIRETVWLQEWLLHCNIPSPFIGVDSQSIVNIFLLEWCLYCSILYHSLIYDDVFSLVPTDSVSTSALYIYIPYGYGAGLPAEPCQRQLNHNHYVYNTIESNLT